MKSTGMLHSLRDPSNQVWITTCTACRELTQDSFHTPMHHGAHCFCSAHETPASKTNENKWIRMKCSHKVLPNAPKTMATSKEQDAWLWIWRIEFGQHGERGHRRLEAEKAGGSCF